MCAPHRWICSYHVRPAVRLRHRLLVHYRSVLPAHTPTSGVHVAAPGRGSAALGGCRRPVSATQQAVSAVAQKRARGHELVPACPQGTQPFSPGVALVSAHQRKPNFPSARQCTRIPHVLLNGSFNLLTTPTC